MLRPLVLACALVVIATGSARAASDLPRLSGLYPASGPALPMLDSRVEVIVRGPLVEVVVTQRFHNRTDRATEATYVFPLPADAAVSAMTIRYGTRTIRAAIARREEAQRRYEDAVRAGVVAGVLDQERPDVFTQTVAGIPPQGTVEVTLRYDAMAHFYDGAWGLALPMVVAPRYVPGVATARPTTGSGRAPDTDRAPDASRITPGGAPGAGGATDVAITFTDKVWDVTSPTHELTVRGARATFTDPHTDHDAIVRWKTATAAGWVEHGPEGGFAAVVVGGPPPAPRSGPHRIVLAVDRSASTRGDADALARPLLRHLLGGLTAADRVLLLGDARPAWSAPADVLRALARPGRPGAFDLTRVLQAARPEGAPIVLVTGGLVADDAAAIAAARKLGVPVHVIGIGPAPARGLLTQLATATAGTARFALPGDDLAAIARAVIVDAGSPARPLAVSWGTLAAREVVPGTLPRVGTGQAVLVLARVARAQTANARAGGELFAIEVLPAPRAIDGATAAVGPLARRWARSRLDELLATSAPRATVTALALRFGLVSPYTSMVAIGDEVIVEGGTRRSVAVPVSVPAGMKWQAVKRETTVDVTRDAPAAGRAFDARVDRARPPVAAGPQRPPQPEQDDSGDGEDEDRAGTAPVAREAQAIDVGTTLSLDDEAVIEIAGTSSSGSLLGRRLRLATSFAGGLVRAGGDTTGLAAVGVRLETGRRSLYGVDLGLWLVADDVQGRALLSFARLGITRWLELGGGLGAHLGAGSGPAGSVGLRYHLPPAPRAAATLRYDGAYLVDEEARRGQHALTLGLEWGF